MTDLTPGAAGSAARSASDTLGPVTASLIRRTALVITAGTLPVLVAGPASADVPEGWSDPAPVSLVGILVVIAAIPLALAFVIVLAVYLPAMIRGERVSPGGGATPDQWFGGPRRDAAELEPAADSVRTGGASGSW